MKLLSPTGVAVSCSDDTGEHLKRMGYREVGAEKAPAPSPAKRARRTNDN